jgi:hypothetical protein
LVCATVSEALNETLGSSALSACIRWALAVVVEFPAVITPRFVFRPNWIASARVKAMGPSDGFGPGTLPCKSPLTWTDVLKVSLPLGEVVCCTETEPVELARPD